MAKMIGAWMYIQNPDRSAQDDLHLHVGAVLALQQPDPKGLYSVTVKVMDDDPFFDDDVHTDTSFQRNAPEAGTFPFGFGITVPRKKLRDSEPGYEHWTEIYCRVSARLGNKSTNWANSQVEDVKI
jgi:hypothetical protein